MDHELPDHLAMRSRSRCHRPAGAALKFPMAPDRSDAELLAGTTDDFETLYLRTVGLVEHYVARRVQRPDLTYDIVSKTYARALRSRHRYRPEHGPAIAWLLTLAANIMRDAARRGRVADVTRRRLGMQRLDLDDAALRAIEHRTDRPLTEALERLPAEQCEAVRRRIVDDEPYPAIAASVGCSEQAIRQRVHRGLRALRRTTEEPNS